MSLINDMLRDLEAKRPDDFARQNLQREIRSLPALKPRRLLWPWALLLVLLSAGGVIWWFVQPARTDGVPAGIPQVVAAPPVVAVESRPVEATVEDKLRLAFELSVPPLAAPMPPVAEVVVPPVAPTTQVSGQISGKEPPTPSSSAAGRIEKSPVQATPHDRAEAEMRKAEAAFAAGHGQEGMEALQAALRQDPAFIAPRQALLAQLLSQRRLGEAARLLEEGLALQPGQTGWASSLARIQLEQGDLAKADETLARYQNQAMHLADYAGFQGHLKSRLGQHAEAVNHYSRAVRMAPAEGRWWLGLGLALQADGKPADAREAFQRALASGSLSPELVNVARQQLGN